MKSLLVAATLALGVMTIAAPASAKGCLAGAAVGGTAGHFAGHHGLAGAAIGCAVGRHRANKKDRAMRERDQAANSGAYATPAPVPARQ